VADGGELRQAAAAVARLDSDYSLFIFRSTHALTSKCFACSPNSARQSLIASILVLGTAWIAATEKVSTAITATARRIGRIAYLTLQLHFRFEMGAACFGLVSSSPE
jgi:hypothetical protein